jgi:hypothetical protein
METRFMVNKVLLWVDDNSGKYREIIVTTAKNRGLDLKIAVGVSHLESMLEQIVKEKTIIQGIILDLMIHGADSLADFGFPEVTFSHGDAGDVGKYLLKYVFRELNPRLSTLLELELHLKPVLILTVKSNTRIEDFKEYGDSILLAQKYDLPHAPTEKLLRNWINNI